jgi:sulfopropanediol 3-dehydrogenase
VPVVLKSATFKSSEHSSRPDVVDTVAEIIADVRAHGDEAVRRYSTKFDAWDRPSYRLAPDEIRSIVAGVPTSVLDDLRFVQRQVQNFAQATSRSRHFRASSSGSATYR